MPITLEDEVMKKAELQRLAQYFDEFEAHFSACFPREEPRGWAKEYVRALLMDMERKNCWQIAEARKITPDRLKALQHFLYGSTWPIEPVVGEMAQVVYGHLRDEEGIFIVDESGVRRWGQKSVGIARQYLGSVGKVDNGQVGVYLTYASKRGCGFLNTRLFLPEEWLDDRDRCAEAGVPAGTVFRTKPELAAAMVEEAYMNGITARWLTADELYGNNPSFLSVVDAVGAWYVCEIPTSFEIYQPRARRTMRFRPVAIDAKTPGKAASVATVVRLVEGAAWHKIRVAVGTQGPRLYEFAFLRAKPKRDGEEAADRWIMVRRSLDQQPEIKYYISNAPADAAEESLAIIGSERWRVEGAIKEAKGQTGLDESEGRSWRHWHHHTALSMLAHTFLTCARLRSSGTRFPPLGKANAKAPRLGEARAGTGSGIYAVAIRLAG